MVEMKKLSLEFISFLQALGLTIYVSLVGLLMQNGNAIFGQMDTFLGPTLFLIIFVLSAVLCGLVFGYYPFILWWEHKETKKAVRVVFYTAGWLVFFGLFTALLIILFR